MLPLTCPPQWELGTPWCLVAMYRVLLDLSRVIHSNCQIIDIFTLFDIVPICKACGGSRRAPWECVLLHLYLTRAHQKTRNWRHVMMKKIAFWPSDELVVWAPRTAKTLIWLVSVGREGWTGGLTRGTKGQQLFRTEITRDASRAGEKWIVLLRQAVWRFP